MSNLDDIMITRFCAKIKTTQMGGLGAMRLLDLLSLRNLDR
jgi:hypothetical protein